MKKLACFCMVIALLLTFAACAAPGTSAGGQGTQEKTVTGKYMLNGAVTPEGQTLNKEEMIEYLFKGGDFADSYYLIITEPGLGSLTMAGETRQIAYDANSLWLVDYPEQKQEFSLTNGQAFLEMEGGKLIFQKVEE